MRCEIVIITAKEEPFNYSSAVRDRAINHYKDFVCAPRVRE